MQLTANADFFYASVVNAVSRLPILPTPVCESIPFYGKISAQRGRLGFMLADQPTLDVMPANLRFLELGVELLFKRAYPQQTDMYYSGTRHHSWYGNGCETLSPRNFWSALKKLKRGEYDLIVAHPPMYAPWQPRSFLTMLKYRPLSYPTGLFSNYAFQYLLRYVRHTPIVVTDIMDSFGIGTHNHFLFDRCQAYYKRELPTDNWLVFYGTAHRNLPGKSFRHKARYQRYVEKLRPLSIGAYPEVEQLAQHIQAKKKVDVFFAGTTSNISTVRARGIEQLLALREQGVTVDIPEQPLPREEFLRRCAAAYLVWSPAGFGWECFRHYEAGLVGSVPVLSTPTIERHRPLLDGVHALYYPVEGDGLTRVVLNALRDKRRLEAMGQAAREHVQRHHTHGALCRHIVNETLPRQAIRPSTPRSNVAA